MENKKGFTLVETMVVSVLLFTVGIMVVQLFFSSLKGGVKSNFLAVVKENGDYAKTVMERMIRSAKRLDSCSATSLKIENSDGYYTTFKCDSAITPIKIASISGTATADLVTYYLTSDNVAVSCDSLFTCPTSGENKITILFVVAQNITNPKPEETAQQTFETTVTLRNY